MPEISDMPWQPCAICGGHGCHYCKGHGAFIKFLGHWTAYPIDRLDPAWAHKKRSAEAARLMTMMIGPPTLPLDAAQALCPHLHIKTTEIGDAACHVLIRSCRDCKAQLPSDVVVTKGGTQSSP